MSEPDAGSDVGDTSTVTNDVSDASDGDKRLIKQRFARRVRRFYLANALVLPLLGVGFYMASELGYYRLGFFVSTTLFLLWLFNVDRLRLCPACGLRPRGREGLLITPASCSHCGAELL